MSCGGRHFEWQFSSSIAACRSLMYWMLHTCNRSSPWWALWNGLVPLMMVAVMFDLPSCTCLVVAGLAVSRFVVAGIVVLVLVFVWNAVLWEASNVLWNAWWVNWCSVWNIFLSLIDRQWTSEGSLGTKPFPAAWLILCRNYWRKASAVALVRTLSQVRTLALSQVFPCLPTVDEFKPTIFLWLFAMFGVIAAVLLKVE